MKLNFKKLGQEGPQVIILHGVFGFLDNWQTIGKQISDAGFQVYLVDQRNHGRSPHQAPMNYATFAEDLKEFIEQQDLVSPILIGHSMGGKTVMQYAVNYPNTYAKLVIVDIGPKAYPIHHQKLLEGLNALDLKGLTSRQDADDQLAYYESNLGVRQFLLKNLYRTEDNGFAWRFNLPVLTADMDKVGQKIEPNHPILQPTCFIRGAKSDYIQDEDWEEISNIFPKAKLETIDNAGHWIHAEQPRAFLEVLLPFLNQP
ncbi:alpha/beta fold hydrolase [Dyadobacter tibetensis]|uniref:alpha/beta fold hydrolase n=1 Tax=Dyadobacter tibetensis TaxID=1211851 RepID=UPI000472CE52|nr:alpha/beta fold hydrolase [Dyadobacter tibetensis]